MQKNKFIIYCGLFEILIGLVLGGCGKAEENISQPLTEPEANSTAPDVIYTEPPLLELQSVSDERQSAPVDNGLTEKANDILISIDDSYSMIVHNAETGEDIKSDTDSFSSQFSDILIKYINLDIEKDEYQYTDDSVTYRMEIFDSDGRLVQTIDYLGKYMYIDNVRYREKGAGTTEELYLAIDSLFTEDFPTASFGEADTKEVDVIEDVTMEVTYASPKGAHLVFTNHTNEEYTFGDDYELQAWQDGEWRKVDYLIDNAAFHAIGYSLAGNSSVGWGVKWTYFHGILPDGVYRITKTINRGTGQEIEKYRLAAEFTITNSSSRL